MKKNKNDFLPSVEGSFDIIERDDTIKFFSPKDIAELKITVLTSTDPSVKIEALRKIVLTPLPEPEKAALFLRGLADSDVSVRSEAVKCLKQLGLNADVADTIRDLFEGGRAVKKQAAERMAALLAEVSEAEKSVVLLVLTDSLMDEAVPLAEILHVLEGLTEILSERPDQIRKFTKFMTARLGTDPQEVEPHFIRIYKQIGERQRDVVWRAVRDEMDRISDGKVRGVLLKVLWMIGPSSAEKAKLLQETVDETMRLNESTLEIWDMAGCLVRAGDDAAVLLLDSIANASEEKRIILAILLDRVCTDGGVSKKIKREAATGLLGLLKVAGKRLRNRILECGIVLDGELTRKTRREFVKEFVKGLEGGNERLRDSVCACIEKMGQTAIQPLIEMSRFSQKSGERQTALDFLGRVIAGAPKGVSVKDVAGAISMCMQLLDGDFPSKGTAAAALGRMCNNPLADEETVREAVDLLTSKLGSTSYPYEILEGLGYICASSRISLKVAVKLAEVLLRYFNQELPEMKPSVTQDRDRENVYQFGVEVSAYTVMVPLIITAFEKLCLNSAASENLRKQVLESMLIKWKKVASWEEVWGPGNTTDLAGTLERIGCSDMVEAESKLSILESLKTNVTVPFVFQAAARICSSVPEMEEIDRIAEEIILKLFEAHPGLEGVKREEREVFMPALGALAERPKLSPSAKREKKLRSTVVELLFEGLRDDIPGIGECLIRISRLPGLPRSLRIEITTRLHSKGLMQ